ncbi:MAG TPA: hypothetical protein VMA77_22325 [Solirubrobacteraceae bacterium]|nr:hypothetical protein [Solirubrobacteraceae bacterium]
MTTLDDLQTALEALSTERLERLVDFLERDPDVKVTVGAWRPRCPMVIAGFDPSRAVANQPECRFAVVWDDFARSEWRFRIPLPYAGRTARRSDVQLLLRRANAVLAYRSTRERPHEERHQRLRRSPRRAWR